MGRMYDPPHPGALLREDVLPALGLSVSEAARQLGVSRVMLSRIINERAGISPEMAMRLEVWLKPTDGDGPSAESFLRMQASYDLWQISHAKRPAFSIQPARLPAAG